MLAHLWLAFALLLIAQPGLAAPNESEWRRVEVPGAAVAVSLPCPEETIDSISEAGTSSVWCAHDGLLFRVAVGLVNGPATPPQMRGFDAMMAESKRDSGTDGFSEGTVAGRRSFTVTRKAEDGFGMVQVIDFEPGRPISVITVLDRANPMTPSQQSTAEARAKQFIASLELIAK